MPFPFPFLLRGRTACGTTLGMADFQFPILSAAAALPSVRVTNDDLVTRGIETSDEWIRSRTGIAQRYYCGEGESTFTLARDAAAKAVAKAGVDKANVAVLVVATCTPDLTVPGVAAMVHGALGFGTACAALDINVACSGFVHALAVARGLLRDAGAGKVAVVVGAESFSKIVDWNDRTTCVLFGDGAGAVLMGCEVAAANPRGLLGVDLGVDGTCVEPLRTTGGVATTQNAGVLTMNGREVFKYAVRTMGAVPPLLAKLGFEVDDVDFLVPHQANLRIIEAAVEAMQLPMDKVVVTVDQHANTSAASIPLALAVAVEAGRIKRGDIVLLEAFGAGFAWSSAVLRW